MNVLTKIASDSSLRYAIQLIMSAALNAKRRKAPEVTTQGKHILNSINELSSFLDIRRVYTLFLDEKRSTDYLKEYQQLFLYGSNKDDASLQFRGFGNAATNFLFEK